MMADRGKYSPEVGIELPAARRRVGDALNLDLASILLAIAIALGVVLAIALLSGVNTGLLGALVKWTPFLAKGFLLNVVMSLFAIILGTMGGVFLGMGQLAPAGWVSMPAKILTQFFRNAPWLVLLFYCIFLLPFQIRIGGQTYTIASWLRAAIGFTIPVIANFSEIVRGAMQSIPSGQWEAARSLGYTWRQTVTSIILPQCIKRMLPPWMNLYAVLLMATPLASIVGAEDALTNVRTALQAESNSRLLLPLYAYLLSWFFIYSYPIARLSMALESRFAVR
jgi:polar amino acid transport system permease protein